MSIKLNKSVAYHHNLNYKMCQCAKTYMFDLAFHHLWAWSYYQFNNRFHEILHLIFPFLVPI